MALTELSETAVSISKLGNQVVQDTVREYTTRRRARVGRVTLDEIDWEEIKELTDGYSASDLEIIASKAARNALKQARSEDDIVPITQSHIEESIESTEMTLNAWD